jgi:naphthalene 1,2-dioxygenase system ferredoxin subunit
MNSSFDNWTDVAAEADFVDATPMAVSPTGYDIALYRHEGQVYATDNICTHGAASLCDGFQEGYEIECPFHQGRFDFRTGAVTAPPCMEPIRVWPVKVEGGRVYLQLD